jgi:hypothetical protein
LYLLRRTNTFVDRVLNWSVSRRQSLHKTSKSASMIYLAGGQECCRSLQLLKANNGVCLRGEIEGCCWSRAPVCYFVRPSYSLERECRMKSLRGLSLVLFGVKFWQWFS